MRILLYGYEYPPLGGGTGTALKHLLLELSRFRNLKIDFVTSSLNNEWEEEQLYPNITFYRVPIGIREKERYYSQKPLHMVRYSWNALLLTWKLIFKHKYDITHFFGFPGGLVSLLFRWRYKYIISLRGVDVPGYNARFKMFYIVYKPLAWLIWKFASRVIANSQGLRDLAKKTTPRKKIDVISNGIDTKKFKPVSETRKSNIFTVTAGGTLFGKNKGLRYLIEGFARLNKKHSKTKLVLIGTGDLEEELIKLVDSFEIKDSVDFVGMKSNEWIAKNLPKYHAFVLPSLNEGMSNAALEALSSGLPLILTDTGGTKEILKGNGYIIKKKNSDQIYERLRELYKNKQLRNKMGKESRQIAEKMSWGNVATEYLEVYNSLTRK